MANFSTHIQVAAVASGAAATGLLSLHQLTLNQAIICWCAGTLGGILPDIDSDNSHSLSILFGVLSFAASIIAVVLTVGQWPITWVWGLCLGLIFAAHWVVRPLFELFTVHRGVFHSLIAIVLFAVVTSAAAFQLGMSAKVSWWLGLFIGGGAFVHLLLDEIFAVDFMNIEVKRSFGTALKVFDYDNKRTASLIIALIGGCLVFAPPVEQLQALVQGLAPVVDMFAGNQ